MKILLLIGIFISVNIYAATYSHSCVKPDVNNYNDKVRNYQNCMNEFIMQQKEARSKKHTKAANDAIQERDIFLNSIRTTKKVDRKKSVPSSLASELDIFSADIAPKMDKNTEDSTLKNKCSRPIEPTDFTDNRQVKRYNKNIGYYKNCIDEFVNEHKNNRQQFNAVNDAIKEWNSFAKGIRKPQEQSSFTGFKGTSSGGSHSGSSKISTGWKY